MLLAAVPLALIVAGCGSADLFAGPDPLGSRPPLAHDTIVLRAVIAAELDLIYRYKSAVSTSGNALFPALLAQHQQHLSRLKARLITPPGTQPTDSPTHMPEPAPPTRPSAWLRDAELASAASLTGRLVSVGPSLAQLFASIAASDVTHADALGGT